MKEILALYGKEAHDSRHPLVCFDEQSVQLVRNSRPERCVRPGRAKRRDYEYVRCGTRNLFVFVTPKAGQRNVLITLRRTKHDFAKAMHYLADVLYPGAETIEVILDNLNTHHALILIEIFGNPEADRLLKRLRFHYTPLHASWLNLAESELSVLTRQCLDRRIDTEWLLSYEIICWEHARNRQAIPISWSLDWKRAKRLFAKKPPDSIESTSQN
jgi:DDE superfamily endonuclease